MSQRRQFLKGTIALAAGAAATSTLAGCTSSLNNGQAQSPVKAEPGKPLPWINWAGNQHCFPKHRIAPTNESELIDAMKTAKGVVRPVGAGHSFTPVVPTNDTLLSTDLMSGIISHDNDLMQAEVWSGTRMHNLGPMLQNIGQALPNMPDMDYPSMGGAIANSVHGTGTQFGSMSSYVTALKLATPAGDLIECSAEKNADIFHAAKTSVGALGVISSITLQNQPTFDLTETNLIEKTEDVLDELDQRFTDHRHFELLAIPYTPLSMTVTTDLAKAGDKNQGQDDPYAINILKDAYDAISWLPMVGERLYETILVSELNKEIAKAEGQIIRTGPSFKVLPHARIVRFREMEYTVPVELGPACLREILATVRKNNIPLPFPIEYRHIQADDVWLSMFEGQTGAAISIHQFGDRDYKAVFAQIEPIFWKYNGRPHWGKIHTLSAKQLATLYPRHWQDFQEVRHSLDPKGKMMNDHLKKIFGSSIF